MNNQLFRHWNWKKRDKNKKVAAVNLSNIGSSVITTIIKRIIIPKIAFHNEEINEICCKG